MRSRLVAALLPALLLGGVRGASGQERVELTASRHTDGVALLRVQVEYGAGHLEVGSAPPGLLYEYRIRYDAARARPARNWSVRDGSGMLRLSLEGPGGEPDPRNVKRGLRELGSLSLGLTREVPVELQVHAGAAEATLALGGVPLRRLRVATGASETRLHFDERNPTGMEELELEVGAASFHARGLGNARFRMLRFDGGIGEVTLDFTGEWDRDARASVDMGIGALRLRLPRDLGVRVNRSTFLTSFEAPGLQRRGDAWVTENWESAAHRLEIDLDATLGGVRVERVP